MDKLLKKYSVLVLMLLATSSTTFATEGTKESYSFTSNDALLSFGVFVFFIVFLGLLFLVIGFGRYVRKTLIEAGQKPSWLVNLFGIFDGDLQLFTGEDSDVLLEAHDYDGIQEYDNDLPPWWKQMFYLTIVFGIAYMAYYHVFDGPSSADEYDAEVAAAQLLYADVDMTYDKITEDNAALETAKVSFSQTCVACHGKELGGGLGPNLTDKYWIYGGDVNDVYKTIKYGAKKGMAAWKSKFSNKEIYELASYVLTLQGTKPVNAKDPEGELQK